MLLLSHLRPGQGIDTIRPPTCSLHYQSSQSPNGCRNSSELATLCHNKLLMVTCMIAYGKTSAENCSPNARSCFGNTINMKEQHLYATGKIRRYILVHLQAASVCSLSCLLSSMLGKAILGKQQYKVGAFSRVALFLREKHHLYYWQEATSVNRHSKEMLPLL